MKEIIYLDIELIHSFLAQVHDGLPGEISNERGQEEQESSNSQKSGNSKQGNQFEFSSGKVTIPMLFETPEGKVKLNLDFGKAWSESAGYSQTESGKEIISKKLHDNALELFIKYLEENSSIKTLKNGLTNEYVKFKSPFRVFDYDYLDSILNPKLLVDMIFYDSLSEMESQKELIKLMTNSKEKSVVQQQLKVAEKEIRENIVTTQESFDFSKKALEFLGNAIPTKTFATFESSFTYLKQEFLREDPKVLMFKYSKPLPQMQVTVLAKKIRKITASAEKQGNDTLFDIPEIVDTALINIDIAKDGDYLLSPIAIYFE